MTISKKILRGIALVLLVTGIAIVNGQITEAASEQAKSQETTHVCAPVIPYAEMNSAQKAEFKARHEKMLEWHKKDLKEAVVAGKITQKDADERLAKMQEMFKNMQDGKMKMHNDKGHDSTHSKHK